jgi:energy-converting hydrogenase Eha subunit H
MYADTWRPEEHVGSLPFADLSCTVSSLSLLIIMLTVGFCVVCFLVDTVYQVEEARYIWASC